VLPYKFLLVVVCFLHFCRLLQIVEPCRQQLVLFEDLPSSTGIIDVGTACRTPLASSADEGPVLELS
jgi:hypothetical protein